MIFQEPFALDLLHPPTSPVSNPEIPHVQAVLDHCRIEAVMQTGNPNAAPVCGSRLDRYWSNVPQSMLTLFMSITGGLSWIDALEALTNFSVFALSFFVIYIVSWQKNIRTS